jgi:hypothetical protein
MKVTPFIPLTLRGIFEDNPYLEGDSFDLEKS